LSGTVRLRLPRHVIAGDAGIAVVTVNNAGPGVADGSLGVAVDVSADGATALGQVGIRTVVVRLKAGRSATVAVPFKLPAALAGGSYMVLAQVDSGNAFVEADEANNTAVSAPVAVAARTVAITASAAVVPGTARAGRVAVVGVVLANSGTVASSGAITFTVTATPAAGGAAEGVVLATRATPVAAGGRRAVRLWFAVPSEWVGAYVLSVRVAPAAGSSDAWSASATAGVDVLASRVG
jgi:hypothetical protein